MIPIIGPIIDIVNNVLGAGKTVVEGWQQRVTARQEHQLKIEEAEANAQIALADKKATSEIDWEKEGISNMDHSWKDEYLLILFSIPMIMSFVPGLAPFVAEGFTVLREGTPEWFQWGILVMVGASYGYRKIADFGERFIKK